MPFDERPPVSESVPPGKKRGLDHLFAATGYSLSGLRVLLRESAFRQELVAGGAILLVHLVVGVPALAIGAQAVLILLLFAVEAINTAIEAIVDRLSPEWSDFARDAKDVGSLAVLFLLLANTIAALGFWIALGAA